MFDDTTEIITRPARLVSKEMDGIDVPEVDGRGFINITNTGGSSASEGGMGAGGGADKGEDGEMTGTQDAAKDTDKWDPLRPKEDKKEEKSE